MAVENCSWFIQIEWTELYYLQFLWLQAPWCWLWLSGLKESETYATDNFVSLHVFGYKFS
jgi:hypothetical protein